MRVIIKSFFSLFSVLLAFSACGLNSSASSSNAVFSKEDVIKKPGFIYAENSSFFDYEGNEYKIRGMNFCNNVYASDNFKYSWANDHNEESYKELSQLGFNTIRYYLNYRMFESDDNPGVYSEESFFYMDQAIVFAKKYGMRILFNMHYPQGGYQSSGSGKDLWQGDKASSNQKRLINLWAEFARRYADETGVLGYGLVNEPYLLGSNYDDAMNDWSSLAQRISNQIRKYDKNHIIFVERAYQIKNTSSNASISYTAKEGYPALNDGNFAYEIHFYEPGVFTNQGISWSSYVNKSYSWPNEENVIAVYNRKSLDSAAVSRSYSGNFSTGTEWQELQTDFYTANNEKDTVSNFKIICSRLGSSSQEGSLYLDYLEMIEKTDQGERVVYKADFEESTENFAQTGTSSFLLKSALEMSALGIEDCNGALEVKQKYKAGENGYAHLVNQTNQVPVKNGRKYSIKIRFIVNAADGGENTNLKLQFIPCTADVRYHNKDFLAANLKPFAEYAAETKVPLYVGEFGLYKFAFFEINYETDDLISAEKGGGQYIRDLISVFDQYNLAYSYHCYHENGFGLYRDAWKSVPSASPAKEKRIEELYQAFEDVVKK